MVSDEIISAAKQLLEDHQRDEDYDYDEQGRRLVAEEPSVDEPDDEYLPCALCSHDMASECGIGERDYFVTGQHICVCCSGSDDVPSS